MAAAGSTPAATATPGGGGSWGSTGSYGGTGQAPGTSILPPSAQLGFQAAYKNYAARNFGKTSSQLELDALESYCGGYTLDTSPCGPSLTATLVGDYERSNIPLGIFEILDMNEGGDYGRVRDAEVQQTDQSYLAELAGDNTTELSAEGSKGTAALCGGESFTAATKVLLASGTAIPISKLKPGDKILATNTTTGKTTAEKVLAVLVHHDTNLYNLMRAPIDGQLSLWTSTAVAATLT